MCVEKPGRTEAICTLQAILARKTSYQPLAGIHHEKRREFYSSAGGLRVRLPLQRVFQSFPSTPHDTQKIVVHLPNGLNGLPPTARSTKTSMVRHARHAKLGAVFVDFEKAFCASSPCAPFKSHSIASPARNHSNSRIFE